MVQHAINAQFSGCGVPRDLICLAPCRPPPRPLRAHRPALRRCAICFPAACAQMNTKYIESPASHGDHMLNMVIPLTSADIQSTITSTRAQRALAHLQHRGLRHRQANLCGAGRPDGDGQPQGRGLREKARELKERAVLFWRT